MLISLKFLDIHFIKKKSDLEIAKIQPSHPCDKQEMMQKKQKFKNNLKSLTKKIQNNLNLYLKYCILTSTLL